ncbi:MAG: mechanosensitive ion channel domain-containing protein [Bacteroidota bacterium]
MSPDTLVSIFDRLLELGERLLTAGAIIIIGLWLAKLAVRLVKRSFTKANLDATLSSFLESLIYYGLVVFVIIAALNRLGVQTASFVAVLGAVGLAIGLATEGSLSNFAAGALIALFHPFRVGDFVEIADSEGHVEKIQIFNTVIRTLDNETVIIPNSEVTGGKIVNYSAKPYVRAEVPLLIGHDADFATVEALLFEAASASKRVLAEPAAEVQITDFTENGLRLQVEVTTLPGDREDVVFEVAGEIKRRLDAAGIRVPQRR